MNYQQIKILKKLIKETEPWNRVKLGIKVMGSGSNEIFHFSLEPASVIMGTPETLNTWVCNIELTKVPLDSLWIRAIGGLNWLPLFDREGKLRVTKIPNMPCLKYNLALHETHLMLKGDLVLDEKENIIGYLFEINKGNDTGQDYISYIPFEKTDISNGLMEHLGNISVNPSSTTTVIKLL